MIQWVIVGVWSLLRPEGLLEQPYDDWEVAALIVGGEEDGVFVADSHVGGFVGRLIE